MVTKEQERRAAADYLRSLAKRIEAEAVTVRIIAVRAVEPTAPDNIEKEEWERFEPSPNEQVSVSVEWPKRGDQ